MTGGLFNAHETLSFPLLGQILQYFTKMIKRGDPKAQHRQRDQGNFLVGRRARSWGGFPNGGHSIGTFFPIILPRGRVPLSFEQAFPIPELRCLFGPLNLTYKDGSSSRQLPPDTCSTRQTGPGRNFASLRQCIGQVSSSVALIGPLPSYPICVRQLTFFSFIAFLAREAS